MIDLFTKQEKIFICFLLCGILIGAGIELYQHVSTSSKTTQKQKIEDFERQIHKKAALIDSLLDERTLFSEQDNFSNNKKLLTKSNNINKSTQNKLFIEINTATIAELVQLPQIGPVIANRIVEYRNAHGAFKNIDDLIKVKGIGKKKLNTIKPYIYINQK